MKIATYNAWNSESGMPIRLNYIIDEIFNSDADIMCLQEVQNRNVAGNIAEGAGYKYWFFDSYRNNDEGLCILSRCPFEECVSWLDKANAIYCSFLWNNKRIAIVNLHLPWDSTAAWEKQIVDIVTSVEDKCKGDKYDYTLLAGDFNCSDTSDVHRFLTGECLIDKSEAAPCWFDLALSYAELSNTEAAYTLDFRKNPRFKNNTIEQNSRFDRILLKNTYPAEFPTLKNCITFGQTIYKDIALSASDHYGVMADVDFY